MAKKALSNKKLSEKIREGLQLANQRLLETAAKNNDELIIYQNGKVVSVKAKKLLAKSKKAE